MYIVLADLGFKYFWLLFYEFIKRIFVNLTDVCVACYFTFVDVSLNMTLYDVIKLFNKNASATVNYVEMNTADTGPSS